jgi:hypothetical protein
VEQEQVEEIIGYAIQQLQKNDADLLEINVSERAVMFHLGRYIREKTPAKFDVDCEYNRHFKNPKQLWYLKNELDVPQECSVFPDILIHRRNSDEDNILVMELKKIGEDLEADKRKLKAFKVAPYSYAFAVQVVINNHKAEAASLDYEFV